MKLGEKIRYLREVEGSLRGLDRDLNQQEMVRAIEAETGQKLSQSYISQIESGARPHLTNTTRQILATFFKVHPGYLVDDPEGYSPELQSELRHLEDKLDLWLVSGAERFRRDPELKQALLTLAQHERSRECLLLLEAILETPGLAPRLAEVLRPKLQGQGTRDEGLRTRDQGTEKQGTGNREQGTEKQGTGNREQGSEKQGTGNREQGPEKQGTGNREQGSEKQGTGNREQGSEKQGTGIREQGSEKQGTGNREQGSEKQGTGNREQKSEKQGTGNREQGPEKQGTGNREQGTEKQGTGNREQGSAEKNRGSGREKKKEAHK